MPFKSRKQQRFMYANKKKMEAQGVDVDEWSDKTDYKHLPEKAAMFPVIDLPDLTKVAWDLNPRVRAAADIAGLGILAEPTIHKWVSGEDAVSEREKDLSEVGGLGLLAAIEAPHLFKGHEAAPAAPKVAEANDEFWASEHKVAVLENFWHPDHMLANSPLAAQYAPGLAAQAQKNLLGKAVSSSARPAVPALPQRRQQIPVPQLRRA